MSPDAYSKMAETESRHWWFVRAARDSRRGDCEAGLAETGADSRGRLGDGVAISTCCRNLGKCKLMEMDAAARAIALERTGAPFRGAVGALPDMQSHFAR